MSRLPLIIALVLGGLLTGTGFAFIKNVVGDKPVASGPLPFAVDANNTPDFPAVKTGDFDLIDQYGRQRRSASRNGSHQLVFFGYAQCKAICSVALPSIAETVDLLKGMGSAVTPVLITVDPKRDTVDALRVAVRDIHPTMEGLTGPEEKLEAAYKAFNLEKKFLFTHPEEGDVYAHGSFIYLLAPDGEFRTLFAPVTSPARMAEITAGYIQQDRDKDREGQKHASLH
ncbi:MAG: SCO family protein [Pseudomonadota bacterium]